MQTYYLHPVNESQAAHIQELHTCVIVEKKNLQLDEMHILLQHER